MTNQRMKAKKTISTLLLPNLKRKAKKDSPKAFSPTKFQKTKNKKE
jgi:hypothetical protein